MPHQKELLVERWDGVGGDDQDVRHIRHEVDEHARQRAQGAPVEERTDQVTENSTEHRSHS